MNKYSILKVALLFGLLVCGVNAVSADPSQIYVSPTGNDSWDGQFPVWQNTTYGPKLTIKNATGTVTTDGTVYVASGTYNENSIGINKNVNIIGENKDTTIINGTNKGAIMSVGSNRVFNLFNLTFTNGNATGGGAIANNGILTIDNCVFSNNIGNLTAGAIYSVGTTGSPAYLTITNSQFINNRATSTGWGGAIFNALSYLTVTGSDFENNVGTTGSTIHNNYGYIMGINFNRIIGSGTSVIYSDNGGDATLNWWGSNASPLTKVSGVTVDPWLILTVTPESPYVTNGSSTTNNTIVTADLQHDVYTTYYDPASGHVPDGIPITFANDAAGTVDPTSTTTLNGSGTTLFTAGPLPSISTISTTLDTETVTTDINIIPGPIFNTRTLVVYNSIQSAIDDSLTLDGDSILVLKAIYNENVVLNKMLLFNGLGMATINALDPSLPALTVTSAGSYSVFDSFIFSGATNSYGIFLDGANSCAFNLNNITNNGLFGILISSGTGNLFTFNNVTNNGENGFQLENSPLNMIQYNTIIGNNEGIHLSVGSDSNDLTGNDINSNTGKGIVIDSANSNNIDSNNAYLNTEGLFLSNSTGNIVTYNLFFENTANGVDLTSSNNNLFIGNTIYSNAVIGMLLIGSSENNLLSNILFDNGWANLVLDNSALNNITTNTFSGSSTGIYIGNNANLNILSGNIIDLSTANGIEIVSSDNNQLLDNNQISNSGSAGILFNNASGNIIISNLLVDNIFAGINLDNSSNNYIGLNSLSGGQNGMYVGIGAINNLFDQNQITLSTANGIWAISSLNNITSNNITFIGSNGIFFNGATQNNIFGNTINASGIIGILLAENSTNNNIAGNDLNDNLWTGICLDNSSNNSIHGLNIVYGGQNGLYIGNNANNNLIALNIFSLGSANGIWIDNSSNNTITQNTINNNGVIGVLISNGGTGNNLTYNTIQNNGWAGVCIATSTGNNINHNNFISNPEQAYDDSTNNWDNGVTGNYWNDWPTTTPRPISGGSNTDNFPSTTPF